MVAIVRYGTRAGPDNQQILRISNDTIRLTNHGATSIDLSEVARMKDLQRIDIATNRLEQINLSPLADCKELKHLDISDNRIQHIDLAPLAECKHLVRLDLSHNELREIDISPLVNCTELEVIYMHENRISEVNATALLNCPRIAEFTLDYSSGKKMILVGHVDNSGNHIKYYGDPLLEYAIKQKKPSWLKHEQMKPLPTFQSYSWLVKKFGWAKSKDWMISITNLLGVEHGYPLQQILFENLGMPELACYDGDFSDIIRLLPDKGSYKKGVELLRERMIKTLQEQLDNEGSTLFFDIDALSTRDASVLIPVILNRRKKELERITLLVNENSVDLKPLWKTGYGYEILKALKMRERVSRKDFAFVRKAFAKIGIKLRLSEDQKKAEKNANPELSKSLRMHIFMPR
ncbi:MAG: leucine-rich repeat domain-containing protein [Candidatus Thorarchaeota archaeon]